VQDIK